MDQVTTPSEFKEAVLDAEGPVLTIFHAAWCSFCQTFLPKFRGTETIPVKKVEIDISEEINPLWDTYLIEVVPTLILFEGGSILGRADGVLGKGLAQADLDGLLAGSGESRGKG
ncbi:MAG: thioredoxin family protein [Thermoplasmata archaeon]